MTQAVDFRFELLFLLLVATTFATFAVVMGMTLAKRGCAAKRVLKFLGIGWGVYLAIVLAVAAATPQRVIALNHDICIDEMCFAVVNVDKASQLGPANHPVRADGTFLIVTVRVTSRARGRTQSEQGLRALLWSPQATFPVSANGQAAWNATHAENAALTVRLRPGETNFSNQVFDVPVGSRDLGLALTHGFGPGYFVIGECPLLHKPTILRVSTER